MDHFKEPMTRLERRVSLTLAHVFALRMLGFFIVLPVLAEHARILPGGESGLLVGLAMGAAGLAQACLQIPLGWASDRYGRRLVIASGLACVLAGSLLCASASEVYTLIAGRVLQGCGAVSAAISALIADHTRESQRTKAMALVGIGIGLSFTVSLALGPWLYAQAAMGGIFLLTAFFALASIGLVLTVPAPETTGRKDALAAKPAPLWASLRDVGLKPGLWHLDFGIFVLNAVQMAMFVVIPGYIVRSLGLPLAEHWRLYLPVVLLSFVLALGMLRRAEARKALGGLMRAALWLLLAVQFGWTALVLTASDPQAISHGADQAMASGLAEYGAQGGAIAAASLVLLAFFVAFNILEAALPAQVSRLAASSQRGTAMGVFNTAQSLGLFAGGAIGGLLGTQLNAAGVFLFSAVLVIALLFAVGKQGFSTPGYQARPEAPSASGSGVAGST